MIDRFAMSIWATDAVLLGLAYWVGRVHGQFLEREWYVRTLNDLVDEVKALRKKVDDLSHWVTPS